MSKLIYINNTDSTNIYATNLIEKNKPEEFTIIQTGYQLKGKGQGNKFWHSEPNMNLLFSLILYPKINADKQAYLNKAITISLCSFFSQYSQNVYIKWPNDIWIDNKKIAGILIENSILGNKINNCIVGIGININQIDFPNEIPNPISLKKITGVEHNLSDVLENILSFIEINYNFIISGNFIDIDMIYHSNLLFLNDEKTYINNDGTKFKAKFNKVDEYGRIVLEDKNGTINNYDIGEVSFEIKHNS